MLGASKVEGVPHQAAACLPDFDEVTGGASERQGRECCQD